MNSTNIKSHCNLSNVLSTTNPSVKININFTFRFSLSHKCGLRFNIEFIDRVLCNAFFILILYQVILIIIIVETIEPILFYMKFAYLSIFTSWKPTKRNYIECCVCYVMFDCSIAGQKCQCRPQFRTVPSLDGIR